MAEGLRLLPVLKGSRFVCTKVDYCEFFNAMPPITLKLVRSMPLETVIVLVLGLCSESFYKRSFFRCAGDAYRPVPSKTKY